MRYVYLINKDGSDEYKIGVGKNPAQRIKPLQTGNSEKLIIEKKFLSNFATKLETNLHRRFHTSRKNGEWFVLTPEQVSSFSTICESLEKSFSFLMEENPFFQKEISKLKKWD